MAGQLGYCKYHKKQERLCRSHLIPHAFYKKYSADDKGLLLCEVGAPYTKRVPIGIYDTQIICSEADNKIGRYDQYATEFFDWKIDAPLYPDMTGRTAYKLESCNFEMLNLFLMSLIWRCHHADIGPFKKFSIGNKFEAKLLAKLLNGDGSLETWFQFILFRLEGSEESQPFKFPVRTRREGLNLVQAYLLNWKIVIKLDSRPGPEWFRAFAVRPNAPIIIRCEEYLGSNEFKNDLNTFKMLDHSWAK
jgi:hypothetical protein